jgi:hypothetical protein
MEIWKDIPWFEWKYQASNLGNIKSFVKWNDWNERILKPWTDTKWYLRLVLYKNKVKRTYKVHRLICFTFLWDSELQVNHKNWIKDDNRLENLEYVTNLENQKHRREILYKN